MPAADFTPPARARLTIAAVVLALHVAAVTALVAAFAPSLGEAVLRPVLEAVNVTITTPPPPPAPARSLRPAPSSKRDEGAAAPPAAKARPREVVAPNPRIVLATPPAPPVMATGNADRAGANNAGPGTGAGGVGQGVGSGGSGSGTGGGGGAAKAVKIAGDIVSARDYPRETRDLRLGSAVTIVLTVGVDGRPSACRVIRPSRDAEADRITCDLAMSRFRFRPARNANGDPVVSAYGWQQRWFTPERK